MTPKPSQPATRVSVESLDRFRANLQSLVAEKAKKLPSLRYCDLRIEVREEKGALAENGAEKASSEDYTFDFGVRAIAGGRTSASGYYGRVLGTTDLDRLEDVVWDGIKQAHNRARASAREKSRTMGCFPNLGSSLSAGDLAVVPVHQDTVPAIYSSDPRQIPLGNTIAMAVDGCKAMQSQGSNIVYSAASASTFLLRELFFSSDGADLDQSFAQTEGFAISICSGEHGNFELYDFTGHQLGWGF
jgi:TldD protein